MYYVPLPVVVKPDNTGGNHIAGEVPGILMIGKYHQERKKHLLLLQALDKLKNRYRFTATLAGECAREEQRLQFKVIEEAAQHLRR
jgi:hypothetical protein